MHTTAHHTPDQPATDQPATDRPAAEQPTASLVQRARVAYERAQGGDPANRFGRRHEDWRTWSHRNRMAVSLAAALGLPVETITVGDDPHRGYGMARQYPGHLLTTTDPATGQHWRFIPDFQAEAEHGWLLLGTCPHCHAPTVPVARVASLADLGAWHHAATANDNRALAALLPTEFTADPAHRVGCPSRH